MGYIINLRKELKNSHRPLIMTSAGVLIFDENNKLILQRRSDNKMWGIPGGSMEPGETFEEVAIREAYEEINLKVKNLRLFDVFSGEECHYTYPNGDEIYNASVIYVCNEYDGKIEGDAVETIDVQSFSKNELPPMEKINPPDRIIINKVKKEIKF